MREDARRPSPGLMSITNMIRLDHGHVTALFHRYTRSTSALRKQALATNACLALEVHAQLEEEIFYPALARVLTGNPMLDKSRPEHDEMRRVIVRLRALEAGSPEFDAAFHELMRDVMHHVADEESTLLPDAERLLADQLGELGMRMTRRRAQLLAPRAGELAWSLGGSFPIASLVAVAGAVTVGLALFASRGSRRRASDAAPRLPGEAENYGGGFASRAASALQGAAGSVQRRLEQARRSM